MSESKTDVMIITQQRKEKAAAKTEGELKQKGSRIQGSQNGQGDEHLELSLNQEKTF